MANRCAFKKGHKMRVGLKHSEETKKKLSELWKAKYKNGYKHHLKGKKFTPEQRKRLSDAKLKLYKEKGNIIGFQNEDKHWNWKGDDVQYSGVHYWIRKELGRPSKCEHCGTTSAKKFEWANKSKKYKRRKNDWIRLCTKCHFAYDRI